MDKDEALYYKLEEFLDGKLPEKEREELQNRIATDEQVAEQLALVRLERELAGLMADDELEARMQQWSGETETRRQEEENGLGREDDKRRTGGRRVAGLLIVVVSLVVGYWLFNPGAPEPPAEPPAGEENTGELPQRESAPPPPVSDTPGKESEPSGQQQPERQTPSRPSSPNPSPPIAAEKPARQDNRAQQLAMAIAASTSPIEDIGTRSTPEPGGEEPPLEKGFRLLAEGKLDEARQTLESIPPEPRGRYLNARQYLAYTCFEQKDYKAAIPIFEELIEIGYVDEDKMKWYLALSYLSEGRPDKGLPMAREVAGNEREKEAQQAAKALLEALEEE